MPDQKTLLFVYNRDSGEVQPPKNYSTGKGVAAAADSCTLSRVTLSPVGVKKNWKRFLKDLDIPLRFLNRDEFVPEFGQREVSFPAVFVQTGDDLQVLISAEELARCQDLSDLIRLVKERVLFG
jgi:hypothetical protein